MNASDTVLDVRGLRTWFQVDEGTPRAVDGVDFSDEAACDPGRIRTCATRIKSPLFCH